MGSQEAGESSNQAGHRNLVAYCLLHLMKSQMYKVAESDGVKQHRESV